MSKRMDPDVKALKAAVRALNQCRSSNMVRATLDFLWDRYLIHPSSELPARLHPDYVGEPQGEGGTE